MYFDGILLKDYKKRIMWIDIARCISILIILYAHVYDASIISRYVHIFHVPVFFVLSGLVWKKAPDRSVFAKGLFKSLIIPYFVVGILSIIAYQILGAMITSNKISFIDSLCGLFYANSRTGMMVWNRPLWFIPCLVVTKVLWELIANIKKESVQYLIVGIVWSVAIIILNSSLKGFKFPWEFEVALHALPYYAVGIAIGRQFQLRRENENYRHRIIYGSIMIVFFSITILVFHFNSVSISFQYNHYGNYPLFVLGALAGSAMVCSLALLIRSNRVVEFVGQNSLVILLWHKFPILVFQATKFGKKCMETPDTLCSILIGLAVVIASAAFSMIIGFCTNNLIKAVMKNRVKYENN